MASRRRTKLFYQQHQRLAPSFLHISSNDREESISRNSEIRSLFLITRNTTGNSLLSGNAYPLMRPEVPAGFGLKFHRKYSEVSSHIEDLNGMIDVVGNKVVEAAPMVNEVVVAAPVSFALVAAYRYLINYVHCYTGFEWWASIVATTILIRFIELPILIHKLKFHSKSFASLIRPQVLALEKVSESKDDRAIKAIAIFCTLVNILCQMNPLGVIISNVNKCCFFFAILNMAKNVPSFVTGGTLCFTDLTTRNRMYLPIVLALTYWIRLELDPLPRVHGIKPSRTINNIVAAAALLGLVIAGFPTAIYFYAITSNLFSIIFGIVMMDARVQRMVGISFK